MIWPPADPGPATPLRPFVDAGDRFAVFTPLVLVGISGCIVGFIVLLVGALRARDGSAAALAPQPPHIFPPKRTHGSTLPV